MRRSAAALLTRPPPPHPSPAPEGLEAVQAAADAAMRAVDRKFAAAHAAAPSLVLAAPSMGSLLLSRSSSSPALALLAAEAPLQAAGSRGAGLPRSLSAGDLQRVRLGPEVDSNGGAGEAGECRLSPRRAGPLLARSAQDRPQRTDSDCSSGRGGRRAQAGPKPAGPASAAWPRAGAAGRRASLEAASAARLSLRPGAEPRFRVAPAASRVGGGPDRPQAAGAR
jgi:hypothetical protein